MMDILDSCDVDITVKVKSNVNIKKEGIYEILYDVIDDYGFETKAIRKVNVNMDIKVIMVKLSI